MAKYKAVHPGTKDDAADVLRCEECGTNTFHVVQKVMVYTSGGARSVRIWTCEDHPAPESITDEVAVQ